MTQYDTGIASITGDSLKISGKKLNIDRELLFIVTVGNGLVAPPRACEEWRLVERLQPLPSHTHISAAIISPCVVSAT